MNGRFVGDWKIEGTYADTVIGRYGPTQCSQFETFRFRHRGVGSSENEDPWDFVSTYRFCLRLIGFCLDFLDKKIMVEGYCNAVTHDGVFGVL